MNLNFKVTSQQGEEIVTKYRNKVSIKKLAKEYGCCTTTMSKLLISLGVIPSKSGYSNSNKFSEEKELEIIKLYKNGMTQKDIATKFHTFNTSIRRVLLRYNIIPRGTSKVIRYCKHNPFKSYNKHDEYSEYFLGLLLTDGSITKSKEKKNFGINLSLTSTDGYIIREFRDWSAPNQKISHLYQKLNGSYMDSVTITNEETVEWLNRKGNFKNKSYTCKIYYPITWTILRGIFDGDGGWHSVNEGGLNFFICSMSKVFIDQINSFLINQGVKSKVRFAKPDKWHKNGIYYVEVCNYADVLKIGINMYSNAHIFLIRKYDKWLTFYESKKDKYTLNSGNERHSNPEQNLPTQKVINKLGRDVQRL